MAVGPPGRGSTLPPRGVPTYSIPRSTTRRYRGVLYYDIETRYLGGENPFSAPAKKQHEVISFQYRRSHYGRPHSGPAKMDLVDPTKFMKGGASSASAESKLLNHIQRNRVFPDYAMVGWNSLEFDQPVLGHRFRQHGVDLSRFEGVTQIDLMVQAKKQFRRLNIARPFSLRSFADDLIEAVTTGMGENEKERYLGRWGLTGKPGKGYIALKGERLGGADYWKALGDPDALSEFKKYGLRDVDLLAFIDTHVGLSANALDPSVPVNVELLKRMKRYRHADSAAKFFSSTARKLRDEHSDWERRTGRRAVRLQISSEETTGTSYFANLLREGKGGFKTGDVAWLVYDEHLAKELGLEHPHIGAQVRYRGNEYRFDFRSPGQRASYGELKERIARDIGDDLMLAELEGRRLGGLFKWKEAHYDRRAKSILEEAISSKTLQRAEFAAPAGLDEYVSAAVKSVGRTSKLSALTRAAPYGVAALIGADVLASREKTGPFWGALAGGATFFMTRKMATLPRLGAVGAAYGISRMLMGALLKPHDPPLAGLSESGEASVSRKQLTAFGSGWDPLTAVRGVGWEIQRSLARGLLKVVADLNPENLLMRVPRIKQLLVDPTPGKSIKAIETGRFWNQEGAELLWDVREKARINQAWAAEAIDQVTRRADVIGSRSHRDLEAYNLSVSAASDALWKRGHPDIEGFINVGVAGGHRKILTDFGTGWDAAKGLGRALGLESWWGATVRRVSEFFGSTRRSQQLLERITEHIATSPETKLVRELGKGGMGSAYLYETPVRGKKFRFVKKVAAKGQEWALEGEVKALRAAEKMGAASVYRYSGGNEYFMEFIEGSTLREYARNGGQITKKQVAELQESLRAMHKQGMAHGDVSFRNVMVTPQGKLAIIDPSPLEKQSVGLLAAGVDETTENFFRFQKATDELQIQMLFRYASRSDQASAREWTAKHLMMAGNSPAYVSYSDEAVRVAYAQAVSKGETPLTRWEVETGKAYYKALARRAQVQLGKPPKIRRGTGDAHRPQWIRGPGEVRYAQGGPPSLVSLGGPKTKAAVDVEANTMAAGVTAAQRPSNAQIGRAASSARRERLHLSSARTLNRTMNPARGSQTMPASPGGSREDMIYGEVGEELVTAAEKILR